MRALVIHQHGSLENLKLETVPDPQPGPEEVLVDVHAASVNFPDLLVIGGTYQNLPATPFVPGKDFAGTVGAVGAKVSGLKPGDRVMGQIEYGAFAERAVVPSHNCYRMPASMSFSEGAAMGLVYLTAHFALVERGGLKPGETVLVTGAAGGVGLATVQLAKALVTGGSPRYRIYRTRDDRFIAAAPLEERFWQTFCDAIALPAAARDDSRDPQATIRAVAARMREKTAEEWRVVFRGKDLCCSVMESIEQALADPHFKARGVFERTLTADGKGIPALPVPVASEWRGDGAAGYPALGEANALLDAKK